MRADRLQLNSDKTEFLWCTTARRRHLPTTGPTIGSSDIVPSSCVRDLGVFIDAELTMCTHIQRTVSRCGISSRRYCLTDTLQILLFLFEILV